jgi:putative ABC transport system permease protein
MRAEVTTMDFLQDVKHTFRSWRRDPVAAAVLIAVLSLGIGANTAIFAVVYGILFRPLPYPNGDRLTLVWKTNPSQGVKREGPAGSDFTDWRDNNHSFEDMAAMEVGTGTITGQGEPEQLPGLRTSANFFDLLGAKPYLGRLFGEQEATGGRRPVLVISYGTWQRRFGGDPGVLGRQITADGLPYTIIGVTRPDFYTPVAADAFLA